MADFEIKELINKCYNKNEISEICDDLKKFIKCSEENKNNKLNYFSNTKNMKNIIDKHKIIENNVCFLTTQFDYKKLNIDINKI